MNERGAPTPVAWTRLRAPRVADGSGGLRGHDARSCRPPHCAASTPETVDRESAREILADRLEAGAAKAEAEAAEKAADKPADRAATKADRKPAPTTRQPGPVSYPKPTRTRTPSPTGDSMVSEVLKSQAAKEFMRTAAREIARGVFGVGRR